MASQGFRFIHASDFRLELPVDGLTSLPDRFGDAILDAPRLAAERVFDAALREKVDFVVLVGNLFSPRETGPWGALFLIEQFKRLEAVQIPVFWAAGQTDSPDVTPAALRFPSNVHIFPVGQIEEVFYKRDGATLARILGTSWGKTGVAPREAIEPVEGADDLYTIGAYNGRLPAEALKSDSVRYWALGGSRLRETVSRSPSLAVYPGSTLARNFSETGEFGATLVEVGESGRTTAALIRTSPLRWSTETMSVREEDTEEEVLVAARSKMKALQEKEREDASYVGRTLDGNLWLVSWRVEAEGSALSALRYGATSQTIVRDLRSDFAKEAPVVYAVDFEPVLPESMPEEMYERQTILGDYLRMIRYYSVNEAEEIDIEAFMPDSMRAWAARERVKNEIADKRRNDGDSSDVAELTARLKALESKDLPPETSTLYHLTSFDSPNVNATEEGKRVLREKLEQRRTALREAAALGVDLLSENDSPAALLSGNTTKGLSKKNRVIAAEMRNLQRIIDEKEIGS
ncbi:MAG: metallophosphoesterase family protein [Thermoguttaceae bacterium]|jgi:exonuclease SbcD